MIGPSTDRTSKFSGSSKKLPEKRKACNRHQSFVPAWQASRYVDDGWMPNSCELVRLRARTSRRSAKRLDFNPKPKEPIMRAQQGKTNITAIVVIVLIVAIVLIALPLWRNHRIAGHVSEALGATDAAKVAVTEAATVHGGLEHVKASELGYNTAASVSPYAARVSVADGGRITLVTKGTGATPDIQLLLTPEQGPTSAITWIC